MTRDILPPPPALPPREAALHDLANLLDASLRCASAAHRAPDPRASLPALEAALVQMVDLLPALDPSRRTALARSSPTVFDAVMNASDLMAGVAGEQSVQIRALADNCLREYAAPGLFRVLTDIIRSSLESISLACCTAGGTGGEVSMNASVGPAGTEAPASVVIDVADDGIGPPDAGADPFLPGVSGKASSGGLGLAVARNVVERLRGSISLQSGRGVVPGRPGALVRITIPLDGLARPGAPP
jgi:signal transduction histidine kinase